MNILNKEHKINENKVTITQTTEEVLSKKELQIALINIRASKTRILDQNKNLEEQYRGFCIKENEVLELIDELPGDEFKKIE